MQSVVKVMSNLVGEDFPRGDVVAVAEAAGNRQKLKLLKLLGVFKKPVDVQKGHAPARLLKGVSGFNVTVSACGA